MLRDSNVAAVVRTRAQESPLAMIAMRKSTHGFPFVSHMWDAYGNAFGGSSGRRSSAIIYQLKHEEILTEFQFLGLFQRFIHRNTLIH